MKYIRTKDGILKVDGYDNSGTCVIKTNTYAKTYYKEDYIKMTDTIEELCDTYVFVGDGKDCYGNPLLFNIKQDKDFIIKYYFESNVIYAAIWTSKGLIYVAKMNDTGDFQLL